jgi:hypothetical protein
MGNLSSTCCVKKPGNDFFKMSALKFCHIPRSMKQTLPSFSLDLKELKTKTSDTLEEKLELETSSIFLKKV